MVNKISRVRVTWLDGSVILSKATRRTKVCLSHANLPTMQVELRKPSTKNLRLGRRHPSFPNPIKSLNFRVIRRSAWFFAGFRVLGKPKSHRETARIVTTHTGHNGFETSRCY